MLFDDGTNVNNDGKGMLKWVLMKQDCGRATDSVSRKVPVTSSSYRFHITGRMSWPNVKFPTAPSR